MLDTGAQPTMISSTLFKLIRCPTQRVSRSVIGIDAKPFTIRKKFVINFRPWFDSDQHLKETVSILPEPNEWNPTLPNAELNAIDESVVSEQQLADPIYHTPTAVHIVLGVGFFAKIIRAAIGTTHHGTTVLDTSFGAVLMGEHYENANVDYGAIYSAVDESVGEKLDGLLERLWEQDKIGEDNLNDLLTEEQRMVEEHFLSTHKRDADGRFIVKIPFKPDVNTIGSSRQIALHRFMATERRLLNTPELKLFYVEQMREAIRIGHIREVTRAPFAGAICYYVPHHCVTKKPRIVYDGSCKTNTGVALNEVQMLGAKLQQDLHVTLMRFRRHKIAVCADVRKMYNQIKIDEEQWDCQRIFWREHPDQPLKEYWLTVVTFGMTSSAFLAVRCLIQAAREAAEQFPKAARIIERDFYMDDMVTGDKNVEEAIKIAKNVDQILNGPSNNVSLKL